MFVCNFSNSCSTPLKEYQRQKDDLIRKNYDHIYTHELAHKIAGGSFAGAISIEKDANGIPISGHVPIKMPTLNKKDPQSTIEHAKKVIKAALAPSDPSSQDYKVAAEATAIKNKAEKIKTQKQLNYIA